MPSDPSQTRFQALVAAVCWGTGRPSTVCSWMQRLPTADVIAWVAGVFAVNVVNAPVFAAHVAALRHPVVTVVPLAVLVVQASCSHLSTKPGSLCDDCHVPAT